MFDEHGSFRLETYKQILIIELVGSLNDLLVKRLLDEFEVKTTRLAGKPWGTLILATHFLLGTPEANSVFKHCEKTFQKKGLSHSAFVYKMEVQRRQAHKDIDAHPDVTRFPTQSIQEALNFLEGAGYPMSINDLSSLGFTIEAN